MSISPAVRLLASAYWRTTPGPRTAGAAIARCLQTNEWFEQSFALLDRNARPFVIDREQHRLIACIHLYVRGPSVLQGVVDQVRHDSTQGDAIAEHDGVFTLVATDCK